MTGRDKQPVFWSMCVCSEQDIAKFFLAAPEIAAAMQPAIGLSVGNHSA
jgi:hypothetical protein